MMLKRIIAILLSIIAILSIVCSFTSCNNKEDTISKGEVLQIVLNAFGMYDDSASSYSYAVNSLSSDDIAVKLALDWGMIDNKDIDVSDPATKGFLSEVLVKCVDFIDTSNMSSDDILEYAVNKNYVSFEYRGRTDSIRHVTRDEVLKSVSNSFDIWTNRIIKEREDVQLADGVINLADENVSANEIIIDEKTNRVSLPNSLYEKIHTGDTFIVPGIYGNTAAKAYHANNISIQDNMIIVDTSDAELESTIQDLKASGSIVPDLASSYIVDGAGNIINVSDNYQMRSYDYSNSPSIRTLAYTGGNDLKIQNVAKVAGELNFKMDGLKITGKVSKDSVEFGVSGEIWTDKEKGLKLNIEKSYEVKDIRLDYDYDIEWFSIKSAYAKVNYTTVDKSAVKFSWKKEGVFAPNYSNGNGHFLSNATRAILKDSQAKGAKSIKICSIPIVSGGVVSFNLDIKIKISISGSVELSVTTNNVKGIEYKNGKIRYIKDQHQETSLTAKGKAELTLYAGFSFKALGINIIGLGIEGGIGCVVSVTAHLADTSNHLLDEVSFGEVNSSIFEETLPDLNGVAYTHDELGAVNLKCDICTDVVTYGILKFVIDSDSIIGKAVTGKLEIIIFDKDNAKIDFLCAHWEDGHKVDKCTRKYVAFKDDETEDGAETNSSIINRGDSIDIDTYFVNLNIGETYKVTIEDIPDGYSISDIEYLSADSSIATITSEGLVTGISGGYVEIKVRTKDKKYSVSCSIFVVESGVNFSPLDISIKGRNNDFRF